MKNTDTLNGQSNVSEIDKQNLLSEEILKREEVNGTPFTIIKVGNMYFGVLGKHRITKDSNNREEIIKELEEITWDRIIQVIWTVAEKLIGVEKLVENLK